MKTPLSVRLDMLRRKCIYFLKTSFSFITQRNIISFSSGGRNKMPFCRFIVSTFFPCTNFSYFYWKFIYIFWKCTESCFVSAWKCVSRNCVEMSGTIASLRCELPLCLPTVAWVRRTWVGSDWDVSGRCGPSVSQVCRTTVPYISGFCIYMGLGRVGLNWLSCHT